MHLASKLVIMYRILAVIWALIIFRLSTMSGAQLPKLEWMMTPDKFGHAFVYAVLTILLILALQPINKKKLLIAATLATAYGISMEIIQYTFFPGRYFEFNDILANILGVLLALWTQKYIVGRLKAFSN